MYQLLKQLKLTCTECNAFVIPGGKVFVYTGILPVAKNDDGLAAILGHEIAHNLARHASESMSSMVMLAPLRFLFIFLDSTGYTMGLGRVLGDMAMDLGLARPASRKQESEADYIGLMMMAQSCYNPQEAVKVWQRMEIAQKDQDMPEWLSTHPSVSRPFFGISLCLLIELELESYHTNAKMAAEGRSSQKRERVCSYTWIL